MKISCHSMYYYYQKHFDFSLNSTEWFIKCFFFLLRILHCVYLYILKICTLSNEEKSIVRIRTREKKNMKKDEKKIHH